jgi:hypothetical protein
MQDANQLEHEIKRFLDQNAQEIAASLHEPLHANLPDSLSDALDELEQSLSAVICHLSRTLPSAPAPAAKSHTPVDSNTLAVHLQTLLQLLQDDDAKAAQEFALIEPMLVNTPQASLAHQIHNQIALYDFEAALEQCHQLINVLGITLVPEDAS